MGTLARAIGTTLAQWDQAAFPDVVNNPEVPQGSRLISTEAARDSLVGSGIGMPELSLVSQVDLATSVLVIGGYHSCMEQGAVHTDGELVWFEARTAPEHEGIICAWSPFTAQIIEVPRAAFSGEPALVNPHRSRPPVAPPGSATVAGAPPAPPPDPPVGPPGPPPDSPTAPPGPPAHPPTLPSTRRTLLAVGMIVVLALAAGGVWWVSVARGASPEETTLLALAQTQGLGPSTEACEATDSDRDVAAMVTCTMPGVPSSPGSSSLVMYQYRSLADLHESFPTLHSSGKPAPLPDGQMAKEDLSGLGTVIWSDESTMTISMLISPDFSSAELYSWWLEHVDDA